MKLLFALPHFPPSKFGGVSSSMYSVINGLKQYDYEIKVLTTNNKFPNTCQVTTNKWVLHKGFTVNYIKTRFPAFSFRFLLEGYRQIKLVDQVHLSGLFYFPNLIFVFLSFLTGKIVILSPHGELQKPALHSKYWKKGPYLQLERFFFKKVIFRATSEEEAIEIRHFFPDCPVYIIPNFFKFNPPLNKNKLHQIIFLGRICKIKRIENLILACSISKHFIASNYILVIAGPTDTEFLAYESMLRKLIESKNLQNNVKLVGEVNSPLKEELLSQSKALFLVSHSENFGNVVLESLVQGTPVVASLGTPWKSLADKQCGFWIDNSPESIAAKIDEIITMDKERYRAMSTNSILLSQDYAQENVLPKWVDLVNSQ